MLLIGARRGGVKCSSACPWYTDTGMVKGACDQVPLSTHCRMTMHPWMVDCDQFDPMHIETVEVTEQEWQTMLASVKKKAKRQRKLYPEERASVDPWTEKGKWNQEKSTL